MYQEDSLIITKLNVPKVCSSPIIRQRLYQKLNEFDLYRVILLTAPAGYGKTTLITTWLEKGLRGKSVLSWVSLDEDDNQPELFWSYFFYAFYNNSVISDNFKETTKKALFQNSALFNRLFFSGFINDVMKLEIPVLIILDDFHVISNQSIIRELQYLIKIMPENMHILISSRKQTGLELAKLRADDSILEIEYNELAFTKEEAISLFNITAQLPTIPEERCITLARDAEGWAAGIKMIALASSCQKGIVNDEQNLNKTLVFDYMAEEVFSTLKAEIQDFLISTSIPDQFCAELCDYMLEIKNSKAIIKEIEDMNLFISSLDNEGKWYRYHKLFNSFLRKRVCESKLNQLYLQTAKWYESKKLFNKAIDYYLQGKHFTRGVEIVEKLSGEILRRGQAKLLRKWNNMLPKEIVNDNSRLSMNNAWADIADGKSKNIAKYINAVINLKPDDLNLKAEIVALCSTNLNPLNNELSSIVTNCKNTLVYLEPEDFIAQLISLNISITYLYMGCLHEARKHLIKLLSIGVKTDQLYIAIMSLRALVSNKILQGNLSQSEEDIERFLLSKYLGEDITLPAVGMLYASLAEIYYQRNELKRSLEIAEKGLELGLLGEDICTTAENYLLLSKVYFAMGLEKEHTDMMLKLSGCLLEDRFFDTRIKFETHKAEILIRKGEIQPFSKWLNEIIKITSDRLMPVYSEIYVSQIKFLVSNNELDIARLELEKLEKKAERFELMGLNAQIHVLSSLIYYHTNDMEMSVNHLEKAIKVAYSQRLIRIFLNEGIWMEDMLKKLKNGRNLLISDHERQFVDKLLNYYKEISPQPIEEKDEILSLREIEVLELIREGASNAQISIQLFISINTVKTHLLNIYAKLDVHSRTGAVAKAKALKLI